MAQRRRSQFKKSRPSQGARSAGPLRTFRSASTRQVRRRLGDAFTPPLVLPCELCGASLSQDTPIVVGAIEERQVHVCEHCATSGQLTSMLGIAVPNVTSLERSDGYETRTRMFDRHMRRFERLLEAGKLPPLAGEVAAPLPGPHPNQGAHATTGEPVPSKAAPSNPGTRTNSQPKLSSSRWPEAFFEECRDWFKANPNRKYRIVTTLPELASRLRAARYPVYSVDVGVSMAKHVAVVERADITGEQTTFLVPLADSAEGWPDLEALGKGAFGIFAGGLRRDWQRKLSN